MRSHQSTCYLSIGRSIGQSVLFAKSALSYTSNAQIGALVTFPLFQKVHKFFASNAPIGALVNLTHYLMTVDVSFKIVMSSNMFPSSNGVYYVPIYLTLYFECVYTILKDTIKLELGEGCYTISCFR